ncbi:hypothetical protein C8Q80DRAFT_1271322 [Daedaleopsis nitida]|nr:hypothetical protein C8Q80DRAFT_1271322 [Daedaleopsis nitida]
MSAVPGHYNVDDHVRWEVYADHFHAWLDKRAGYPGNPPAGSPPSFKIWLPPARQARLRTLVRRSRTHEAVVSVPIEGLVVLEAVVAGCRHSQTALVDMLPLLRDPQMTGRAVAAAEEDVGDVHGTTRKLFRMVSTVLRQSPNGVTPSSTGIAETPVAGPSSSGAQNQGNLDLDPAGGPAAGTMEVNRDESPFDLSDLDNLDKDFQSRIRF